MGETLLLECKRSEVGRIRAVLEKMIIADDVVLRDRTAELAVLGIEGARTGEVLARASGLEALPAADGWGEAELAGAEVLVAAFGWSGEQAYQLRFAPAKIGAVRAALEASAASLGVDCVAGDAALLEVLRIEAGIPALGAELDEDVLPPEARLERAVANNKGCYVGQEIVARLRSRGQVNHLLVGLRLDGEGLLPAAGTALSAAGRATGEITSVARSPLAGPIALAFVRREHAEVGTRVEFDGGAATVAALPFVAASSASFATAAPRLVARDVVSRGWLSVFAKAPRPGRVKTRLVPPLSPEQAAALYDAMLADVLRASADFARSPRTRARPPFRSTRGDERVRPSRARRLPPAAHSAVTTSPSEWRTRSNRELRSA